MEKIKVLKSPVGLREIIYDPVLPKAYYIEREYTEVEVGITPDITQYLPGNKQARRKQYGLKHHFTSTIYAATGDTLSTMATEVTLNDSNFRM